jgi:hypothetical protein
MEQQKLGIGRVGEGPSPESFNNKEGAILFANRLSDHINKQLEAGRKPEDILDRYFQLNKFVDKFGIDTSKELNPPQPTFQLIITDLKKKMEENSMPPPSKYDILDEIKP